MKKLIENLQAKSVAELQKEVDTLRNEIAKLKIDRAINAGKDSNQISKKIKQIAQLLTVKTENTLKESVNKTK